MQGLPSALAFAVLAILAGAGAKAQATQLDVVEMFTSQACGSCPPADRLLGELARRDGVLALSYSVDYWDYLDWEDTLGRREFTNRQRAYAKRRGDRSIYTPQAVANGRFHTAGSDAGAVEAALAKSRRSSDGKQVGLSARQPMPGSMEIEVGAAPDGLTMPAGTVWLVEYADRRTVKIEGGENEGKTVTYHNVVRRLEPVARWEGEPISITVALSRAEDRRYAVLLQEGTEKKAGGIIAAVALP